ncbi:hypothetical protein ACIRLA_46345 [Streptomyces sp. NPDC102364]|uniref:hypothetical protein n=1 Tax=Streptomyces sp. NPDC102364 TaxID=3366161 RepID=UPI003811598C
MSRPKIGAARANVGALARPEPGVVAQGRRYDRVRMDDLPDPEDVGEKAGPLDQDELELRGMCDKAIDDWDESTVVLAKALANYRARRLYRDTHSDYDSWCQDRFRKTRYWALRLEESYEVTAALMLPAGNTPALLPAGNTDEDAEAEPERLLPTQHTRELKQAKREGGPDEMRAVYEETKAAGKVTGAALKATREKRKREREQPDEAEIVDAEIVDDESPSIDEQLKDAQELLATLRAAWKLWAPAMEGLNAAGAAGVPARQDIGRIVRMFARVNETDNA